MRAVQPATPYGPRRWAHSTRIAPSASRAPAASPARGGVGDAAAGVDDPIADGPERRGRVRGASASVSIHSTSAWPARSTSSVRVDVAAADRGGELGDGAAEAVDAAQHDDAVADRRRAARARCRRRPGRRCRRGRRRPRRRPAGRDRRRGSGGRRRRSASTSLAIIDVDTIDVSSTMTTSYGSRFALSWRKRLRVPGRQPSRRWSVTADRPSSRCSSTSGHVEVRRLGVHGLLEPRRRLAGRGGERDAGQRRGRPPRPARRGGRRSGRRSWSCRCRARRRRRRTPSGRPPRRRRAGGRARRCRRAGRGRSPSTSSSIAGA